MDNMNESAKAEDHAHAQVVKTAIVGEVGEIHGRYHAKLWVLPTQELKDRYADLMYQHTVACEEIAALTAAIPAANAAATTGFMDFVRRLFRMKPRTELVEAREKLGHINNWLPTWYVRKQNAEIEMQRMDALRVLAWEDDIDNVVTTVGKNLTLDTILSGSAFTATVVMGLKGAGTAVVGDTQASHAGWTERGAANAPAYSGTRKTPTFSAASGGSKATSAAVAFTFTSGGNVDGCFININGSSAIDNTTGTLYSAGDFTGGAKTVANTDQLNVTYSSALT